MQQAQSVRALWSSCLCLLGKKKGEEGEEGEGGR